MSTHVDHAEPRYGLIWLVLIGLALISWAFSAIGQIQVATTLIFAVAFLKAGIVATYFMHLKFVPRYVLIIVLASLFVVFLVLFGLIPDIVYQFGRIS